MSQHKQYPTCKKRKILNTLKIFKNKNLYFDNLLNCIRHSGLLCVHEYSLKGRSVSVKKWPRYDILGYVDKLNINKTEIVLLSTR
jgi:hypothetical protein